MELINKKDDQSIFDVLLENGGALSGLFDFLHANNLTSIDIPAGTYIAPEVMKREVVDFYSKLNNDSNFSLASSDVALPAYTILIQAINSLNEVIASGNYAPGTGVQQLELPDIIFVDSNGVENFIPAGQNITAISCAVALDVDAEAFINAEGIIDENLISAINTFASLAKYHGIWDDLDTAFPLVGGNATSHRRNLKNASLDGSFYGGVTHNSNGVTFNGVNGYFDTAWATNSANVYNRHYSQYLVSQSMSGVWSGSFDGANLFGMRIDAGRSLSYMGFNNLEATALVNLDRASVYCVTIDSSSVGKMYNNGNLVKTNATSIQGAPTTGTVFVGALNSSGSPAFYQNSNVRFITTGKHLDATKQQILNNLIRMFNATIGR